MSDTQNQIAKANETDLVAFLSAQGEELIKSGREYRWKAHDSVTINKNQWFRHSENAGGGPVDFVMKFYGLSFSEAVELLLNEKGGEIMPKIKSIESYEESIELDEVESKPEFILPPAAEDNHNVNDYLTNERGIDPFIVSVFEKCGMVYEDADYHNAVFVGYDRNGIKDRIPKYAHRRSTTEKLRMDVAGSDKSFGFWFAQESSDKLMVFEAPIDMMSFLSLYYGTSNWPSCVALGGVSPKSMMRMLDEYPFIRDVYLCLDNDEAGNKACEKIANEICDEYSVTRVVPGKKDWNDVLKEHNANPDFDIMPEKIVISSYEKVGVIEMKDIETKNIDFIWEPYIARGKITIIQGDGGIGKTTLVSRIVGCLTSGKALPGMESNPKPMNVFIQSGEDGYADTIKPRLIEAGADIERVKIIDESEYPLTLGDDRIYRAIVENNVSVIIFDPLQAYLGDADMNRANEMRAIFKKLCRVAGKTNCAVILIGHLNKNNSASISQRSLGSTDVFAAARSVITVAKINNDNERRIMCHTKSNLAPVGKSIEFTLSRDEGFLWGEMTDMKIEEAISGKRSSGDDDFKPKESKEEQAMKAIMEILNERRDIKSTELEEMVTGLDIGVKTYKNARAQLTAQGLIKTYQLSGCWHTKLAAA